MPKKKHDCPESCDDAAAGHIHIGVAGVLATFTVERCDACGRFASDCDAGIYVRRLLARAEEAIELLDDAAASLDACLAHYGTRMYLGDCLQREKTVRAAMAIVAEVRHAADRDTRLERGA